MSKVILIFPHQLFDEHPLLTNREANVILLEDSLFLGDPEYPANFHIQKKIFHRATMRNYYDELKASKYSIEYIEYQPKTLSADLLRSYLPTGTTQLLTLPLFDFILEKRLTKAADELGIQLHINNETTYLSMELNELQTYFKKDPPIRQQYFYEKRRRQTGFLMQDGKPIGGKWSFDEDNRKKLPAKLIPEVPPDPQTQTHRYIEEARKYVSQVLPESLGSAESFWFPTNNQEARIWLSQFLEQRFRDFGTYEDAMIVDKSLLYHSLLSPLLNCGLLTPKYVIRRTLNYAEENNIPLNSTEGFLRQILGWREFVMGMYLEHGTTLRAGNVWNHTNPLPKQFYDGTTGIEPVDAVIKRTLETGYCHHIERLMVLGNIMFLLRIDPNEIYRWFMELFIDSYDWVMVPNVYGMSQNSAGDVMTTKPYFSGSNYILKMSNFKKGAWCDEWDALYWMFIKDNQERLKENIRWALMIRQLEKKTPEQMQTYKETKKRVFDRLGLTQ